jgi:hypothetical protein
VLGLLLYGSISLASSLLRSCESSLHGLAITTLHVCLAFLLRGCYNCMPTDRNFSGILFRSETKFRCFWDTLGGWNSITSGDTPNPSVRIHVFCSHLVDMDQRPHIMRIFVLSGVVLNCAIV